jgi:hypothetical protein
MENYVELMEENFFVVIVGACFIVGMLLKSITTIVTSSGRERSRREIAAYIAEGSITPEQGERLIKADVNSGRHYPS